MAAPCHTTSFSLLLLLARARARARTIPIHKPSPSKRGPFIRRAGDWSGRQPHEHINNRDDDNLNVHSSAANSGKSDRAAEGGTQGGKSQATTEADKGNQNEQAQKDHPEAPGPVIGMNDERGGVSTLSPSFFSFFLFFFFFFFCFLWLRNRGKEEYVVLTNDEFML
ncbi:MAG: hypothetical protein Q9217_000096 [Psora testacea]